MTVDRELLWKAYPDGYLAMRGVSTVGGWLCSGEKEGKPVWAEDANVRDWGWHEMVQQSAQERGDLLPNLDPEDAATWACAKADLAAAIDPQTAGKDLLWDLFPHLDFPDSQRWLLLANMPARTGIPPYPAPGTQDGVSWNYLFNEMGTDDPAIALATARAQYREGGRVW